MTISTEIGIPPTGYRLPATSRPGRVRLQVTDLERSLEWYQRVLGLHVAERRDDEATLTDQSGTNTLVELHERRGATPTRRRLGLYHYALLLPDRAALGAFLGHLHAQGEAVGASDHFVSEALYLNDPDGLGIEVYADRPRAEWQTSEREIVMGSTALDERDLARAAQNTRWNGMPAGTTMGHVHLHVGDLDRAASFYVDALGFDRVVWSYPGALFVSASGYHHHLGFNTWAGNAEPAHADEPRLLDWSLVLPTQEDVRAATASLEGAGYATKGADGGTTVADPWGTALRIVASTAPDEVV